MSLFSLDQVTYKTILTINHLAIPAGKVTCIVGTSGSGKSTLLKLLNRMISPDSGTITWNGTDITTEDAVDLRRNIVMLPQNPVMFPGTVRENVLKGLEFSARPMIDDAEITSLMNLMEVNKQPEANASYLSGGERQRVAIARVLAMKPKVLLLDEPSSALDDGTEERVIGHIVDRARESETELVMVTHSRAIAQKWGENLVEIESGAILPTRTAVHV